MAQGSMAHFRLNQLPAFSSATLYLCSPNLTMLHELYTMLLRGQMMSFACGSVCIVQHWFRLSEHSLITQATLFTDWASETIIRKNRKFGGRETRKSFCALFASETIIRKNRKFGGRETRKSFCALFAASHKFQYVTCVLRGLA